MAGTTLRVGRSRGAFSGILLVLLGIWGGLVPMVGPSLHYAYTPDKNWTLTSGRIWLELLPAGVAVISGILLLFSRFRPAALVGACLAAASGAWFMLGSLLVRIWMRTPPAQGVPVGSSLVRVLEQIGFFTGLGAVIVFIAAIALGRLSVVSARDVRLAERASTSQPDTAATRATTPKTPVTAPPVALDEPAPEPVAASRPSPRATTARAPMAALTRIASRNKPAASGADPTTEPSSLPKRERVDSGASSS
jgi:hypothetical protein